MTRRPRSPTAIAKESSAGESLRANGRRQHIQFFTIDETAEMLRVASRTVRRWIASGELVAHRLGRAVRIADGDLRAFLAIHRDA